MKKFFIVLFSLLCFSAVNVWSLEKYAAVIDECGYLSSESISALESKAESVARNYDCGIYIVIAQNMTAYNDVYSDAYGIEAFAQSYFFHNEFGVGQSQNGILLILSMAQRDYDLMAHGEIGNAAFTDYGKSVLADSFLSYLGKNDWYGAFTKFISTSEYMLEQYSMGKPVDKGNYNSGDSKERNIFFAIVVSLVFGMIVALIVCLGFRSQMKKVKLSNSAVAFVAENGLKVTNKSDLFTHNTVTRQVIQQSSGSGGGGTHINSSGSSHHSGKF